ncbi:NADPH oxidase organizer 1a [Sphaeramia orbicularis]|uniref:NADPH oxidase organizer 1a n=1 Tax=Sphaeramia orbicularis TaxID=375764 RepID=UPI0011814D45|nr:NADPH oxidase organizer 1 [Sphaeramia orbicularis]
MEAQRYPLSVRLVGVMHKEKRKMYIVSVLWSDQNDIVVYRSLGDFQKMHKKLKKAFPPSNKLKKSDRIIPIFRDKRQSAALRKRGPTKSLERLKSLQRYCNELLSCDTRVTQSADLIQFFHPKDQDLQPEFSQNSIMIMPSDDELKSNTGHGNGGNVTQPFVTETYRCVAPYETKCTKNKPFKVALDEKLDVLIKDKAGWWLVENEEKRMAWFPAPYLDKLEDEEEEGEEDEIDGIPERGTMYTAIKNYKATKGDEMTVNMGAVVEVLQKSDNGWWLIRYNGKAGYVPSMFLKPYNYPHIRMTPHLQERPSSSLQIPSQSLTQTHQLSRSQGNLLVIPTPSPSTPRQLQPDSKHKSRSLNILSDRPPSPRVITPVTNTDTTTTTAAANYAPPPMITVEMDGEEEQHERSLNSYRQSSFDSDSTDFSFSDDLSTSSGSSSLNLNVTDDRMRLSRTPPPPRSNHLSPTNGPDGRLMPSVSDPNLYKTPGTPKVPPRPQAQEILTRCSTITRKNLAKGSRSPTEAEILSR